MAPSARRSLCASMTAWHCRVRRAPISALWNFEARMFRPGEYVTLRRPDGEELVFRIVDVEPD